MINPKQYDSKRINIGHLLNDRMLYVNCGLHVRRQLQAASPFINRLKLDGILVGHRGPVNCLDWSTDGRVLASGYEDFNFCLWDPFRKKRIQCIEKEHFGNISSVKFLPKHNDTLIATAGVDEIMLFDINHPSESLYTCHCHFSSIKRLATAPDSPFVFWSAGVDGSVLQLDHREQHTCRSSENQVGLIYLRTEIYENAEAKCLAVNPIRTEYIAVGANDPYARLYDRRMLKKIASGCRNIDTSDSSLIPKECVTYFCPGHISKNNTKRIERESRAITHLTFNATGTELLVNMGADHVYLYDLYNAEQPVFLNLPECKAVISAESDNGNDTESPPQTHNRRKLPEPIEECKKLGKELLENKKYYLAIRTYSDAISQAPQWPVLYLHRARAYMRRLWFGDVYAALKDCHTALKLDPSYVKAHSLLARSLLELGRPQEADKCLKELIRRFPNYANNHGVLMLNKDIKEYRQTTPQQHYQLMQQLLAGEMLDRGKMLDREEMLERGEMTDDEFYWRCKAKDYSQRFVGRCNSATDVQEANYFGFDGNYIVAGSDDGNVFIWERKSGNIHCIYKRDSPILSCVLPHPEICLIATFSGLEDEIEIWSPMLDEEKPNFVDPVDRCVEDNQLDLRADWNDFKYILKRK